MGKVIRRCGSFLMMLLLVIGILPMTVNAETTQNTEERNALYVQVPEDWADPCVWAWDSDGNNAFTAWPGEEMEADAANDGWYYIWLPAWANHVIINANEGNVQTEEQILDTNAAWITVSAADTVEISYESKTTGEAPAYVEKFVVHAKVDDSWDNPCLWAWSAPDGTNAFAAWPGESGRWPTYPTRLGRYSIGWPDPTVWSLKNPPSLWGSSPSSMNPAPTLPQTPPLWP